MQDSEPAPTFMEGVGWLSSREISWLKADDRNLTDFDSAGQPRSHECAHDWPKIRETAPFAVAGWGAVKEVRHVEGREILPKLDRDYRLSVGQS